MSERASSRSPSTARPQVGQHVERAVRAPVAHARRVAVARLDDAHLLQALERLAQGLSVTPRSAASSRWRGSFSPGA